MAEKVYLAVDLGAESGRVMAGLWNGKQLRLEEINRFPNGPVALGDSIRWDVMRLWTEVQNGLALAGKKYGKKVETVRTQLKSAMRKLGVHGQTELVLLLVNTANAS